MSLAKHPNFVLFHSFQNHSRLCIYISSFICWMLSFRLFSPSGEISFTHVSNIQTKRYLILTDHYQGRKKSGFFVILMIFSSLSGKWQFNKMMFFFTSFRIQPLLQFLQKIIRPNFVLVYDFSWFVYKLTKFFLRLWLDEQNISWKVIFNSEINYWFYIHFLEEKKDLNQRPERSDHTI